MGIKKNHLLILTAMCFTVAVSILSYKIWSRVEQSRFSTSLYAPYAYEIAPEQAKGAQTVLTYFELQKTVLSKAMIQIRIRPRGRYMWKTFTLKKGYRLYLAVMPDAEGEFNDTSSLDYLNYDIPILVDDSGMIVKNRNL